ncbi:GntR family transcriptional regulator [Streptomyces sp. 900105755]
MPCWTPWAGTSHRKLRDAIHDGVLRPGEKITERDLAARLGVSPTPVREALRQLSRLAPVRSRSAPC